MSSRHKYITRQNFLLLVVEKWLNTRYGVEPKEGQDTNDMKNARKKFADCVNHEKNENGYPYSFSSNELNTLKGMISGNQLNEAINRAFKKILG